MPEDNARRRFLVASGTIGASLVAGCTGLAPGGSDGSEDGMMDDTQTGGMSGATDPADAPRAEIDRFSESAGTLMVRTDGNGLPGPDEPIDFDRAPFLTHGLVPTGSPSRTTTSTSSRPIRRPSTRSSGRARVRRSRDSSTSSTPSRATTATTTSGRSTR